MSTFHDMHSFMVMEGVTLKRLQREILEAARLEIYDIQLISIKKVFYIHRLYIKKSFI